MSKPKVAVIGTGGTIASIGKGPLDILDYGANNSMLEVDKIIEMFPEVNLVADVLVVPFRAIPSPSMGFAEWKELVLKIDEVAAANPDLAGFVVTHGTASLEETAYVLHLTVKTDLPVVVIGSQRPSSALSTDAGFNLVNGIRTAASPQAKGMGVMTLLNDEIQSAREVTKTSTYRMQTFRTPDFGCLGHADGDAVAFYRKPLRRHAPDTEFDIRTMDSLPRVDIAYAYCGADGTAVRAFVEAGAKGIVSAGFAPGFCGPGDEEPLKEAVGKGITVVQSSRAGSGRTFKSTKLKENGFLIADNLNPQKARILLAFALAVTSDPAEIERIFATY
ncbi:asparaginase [Thalassobaculum sp.]|uniref:asparaginase n=1 Tax=Thalassobaculum sp. TaxID=2022740 RepID=UPI003B5B2F50